MRNAFDGEEVGERRLFVDELGGEEEGVELNGVGTEAEDLEGVEELDEVVLGLRGDEGGFLEVGEDGARERELRGKVGGFVGEGSGLFGGSYEFKSKGRKRSQLRWSGGSRHRRKRARTDL